VNQTDGQSTQFRGSRSSRVLAQTYTERDSTPRGAQHSSPPTFGFAGSPRLINVIRNSDKLAADFLRPLARSASCVFTAWTSERRVSVQSDMNATAPAKLIRNDPAMERQGETAGRSQ